MNDLMTKSFLNYVELKKQAQRDAGGGFDIESGGLEFNPSEEQNLSLFFEKVEEIKTQMEETTNLLTEIQKLNQEAKSTHNTKILHGLIDRINSDTAGILRRAKLVQKKLASLERSNVDNRLVSVAYGEGTSVDRTRRVITKGLRVKLREMMIEFQSLREQPSEEQGQVELGDRVEDQVEDRVGERAQEESVVMDIKRSLEKLHQVFLDMAILVESEGEKIEDIEENVAKGSRFINGGTRSLYYANQMKRKNKKWVYWIWGLIFVILLVCVIVMLVC